MGDPSTKFTTMLFVPITLIEVYLLKGAQGLTLDFASNIKPTIFDFGFIFTKLNLWLPFENLRLLFLKIDV
jgi:hypothetical protein